MFAHLRNPKVVIPLVIGAAVLSAPFVFRGVRLAQIDDIGDPFDVQAFCDVHVAENENAFVEYASASGRLGSMTPFNITPEWQWAAASPELQQLVIDSRPALAIWRSGSEKREALYIPVGTHTIYTLLEVVQALRDLARLARLEGSRLEAEGDVKGAWDLYRAMFRSSRHLGRRGCMLERLVGADIHSRTAESLVDWGADARVDEAMLRAARDEVRARYAESETVSNVLKAEYLKLNNTLSAPPNVLSNILNQLSPSPAWSVKLYLLAEPEFGRRVVQHWFADLLEQNATPDERASIPRHIPLAMLQPIMLRSPTARLLMPATGPFIDQVKAEQARQAALELSLALQIFHRRHGKMPERLEQLVDSETEALPADPFGPPGQTLKYRVNHETGEALVWSLGINGIDDGGDIALDEHRRSKDIGFAIRAPTSSGSK